MNFCKIRISSKLIISIIVLVVLGQIFNFYYAKKIIQEEIEIQSSRELFETAEKYAKDVKLTLERGLVIATTTASAVKLLVEGGVSDRNTYTELITKVIENNKQYAGIGLLFEENLPFNDDEKYINAEFYDETGRNVAYIAVDNNELVRDTFLDYAEEWYKKPKETKVPVVVEPSEDEINGKKVMISTITAPVFANNKYLGVVLIDIPLSDLTDNFGNISILNSGNIFLLSNENAFVAHKNNELWGKNIFEELKEFEPFKEKITSNTPHTFKMSQNNEIFRYFVSPVKISGTNEIWHLVEVVPENEVLAVLKRITNEQIIVSLLLVAVLWGVIIIIARNIATPVSNMTEIMLKVANGNNDIDVPYQNRQDEIGDMANTLNIFKENNKKVIKMTEEQRQNEIMAEVNRKKTIYQMAEHFEQSIKNIVYETTTQIQHMRTVAEKIGIMIDDAMVMSSNGSSAVNMASNNVSTMAASAEELANSIAEISKQVNDSNEIAHDAVTKSNETSQTINDLMNSAGRIGEIINLIMGIAKQTNLLALNATIEAARAGNAGKGFAVVANEVKILAEQTAKATDEISLQVKEIQNIVDSAVTKINSVNKTIVDINNITSTIASAVEEQSCATREISENVQQTSKGTTEVALSISASSQNIKEVANNTSEFKESSRILVQYGNRLKNEIETFLTKIKNENKA